MKDFITEDLNAFTQDELISMFEAIRDKLALRTLTSYSKDESVCYNTVSNRIKSGKLKKTEVDGTIYVPLMQSK